MKEVDAITVADLTTMSETRLGTEDFIEFDSLMNIRPCQTNRSRRVEDPAIRRQIIELVSRKVVP